MSFFKKRKTKPQDIRLSILSHQILEGPLRVPQKVLPNQDVRIDFENCGCSRFDEAELLVEALGTLHE